MCETTSRAAVQFVAKQAAAGVFSAAAAALAQDVLRSLLVSQAEDQLHSRVFCSARSLRGPSLSARQRAVRLESLTYFGSQRRRRAR